MLGNRLVQRPTSNGQRPTANGQHPTSNVQHPTSNMAPHWELDVGCSVLDVLLLFCSGCAGLGTSRPTSMTNPGQLPCRNAKHAPPADAPLCHPQPDRFQISRLL